MVITGGGAIHDMRYDGTGAHSVNDVAGRDFKTKITVVGTCENGVHVLRPLVKFRMRLLACILYDNLVVTRKRDKADISNIKTE
jgi:hypothetical protein